MPDFAMIRKRKMMYRSPVPPSNRMYYVEYTMHILNKNAIPTLPMCAFHNQQQVNGQNSRSRYSPAIASSFSQTGTVNGVLF